MKLKAVVTQEFTGRPDSESMPRPIKVGEEVTGDLARVAIDNKWASEAKAGAAKSKRPQSAKAPPAKKTPPRKARR